MTKEYRLKTPLKKDEIIRLNVGDVLYVSGEVFTSRDRTQSLILKSRDKLPISLQGLIEFHAGPIVRSKNSGWEVVSIGPTTSFRMENSEYDFIREMRVAGVIGKGGMGSKTRNACKEFKAFYGILPGGAAAFLSKKIERILGVYWLEELGVPEAMWHLKVQDLGPIIVAIDSLGNDIYDSLRERVSGNLSRLLQEV